MKMAGDLLFWNGGRTRKRGWIDGWLEALETLSHDQLAYPMRLSIIGYHNFLVFQKYFSLHIDLRYLTLPYLNADFKIHTKSRRDSRHKTIFENKISPKEIIERREYRVKTAQA